jgi:hypothetical protein
MSAPVFLLALAIAATTLVLCVGAISAAIRGRGASRSEIAELRKRSEEERAALEAALANQSAQLAELQERVDFAERLLAQARDRTALGHGEKPLP